jgi:hypothetical protein
VLGVFRKSKNGIIVEDGGMSFRTAKLKKMGNTYVDTMTGQTFTLNGRPIRFDGKYVYLLSGEKGVVLQPELDEDVLKLKTSPHLISTILEPEILQRAFKFKPAMKTVLAALLVGIGIGFFFGLMF